jgi:hypothetical protein
MNDYKFSKRNWNDGLMEKWNTGSTIMKYEAFISSYLKPSIHCYRLPKFQGRSEAE